MKYKVLNRLFQLYWKIVKPTTVGVKIIAMHYNQIVLVKPEYSDVWHLPGGGVDKRETVLDAAIREFYEECGVRDVELKLEGIYSNFSEGKNDHIAVFSTNLKTPHITPSMEIKEAKLFDIKELPQISPGSKRRIEEHLSCHFVNGLW